MKSTALTIIFATFAALGACGSAHSHADNFADLTPRGKVEVAERATADVKSSRVVVDGALDGMPVHFTMLFDRAGRCLASGSYGEDGQVEVVRDGNLTYILGNAAFWNISRPGRGEEIVRISGSRWVSAPAGDSGSSFCDDSTSDRAELANATVNLVKKSTLNGLPTEIIDVEGQQRTRYWIRAAYPHYVLRSQSLEPNQPATVTISDFGTSAKVAVPGKGETIDVSDLNAQLAP
ncbi:MAG: hypothetical protein ACJ72E_04990 [Marmoricola sp.]